MAKRRARLDNGRPVRAGRADSTLRKPLPATPPSSAQKAHKMGNASGFSRQRNSHELVRKLLNHRLPGMLADSVLRSGRRLSDRLAALAPALRQRRPTMNRVLERHAPDLKTESN